MTAIQERPRPTRRGDDGVALVVALLLTLALSAIGASLLLVAETETFSSMNYRMMSQARYGAESGVLRAINHLMNDYDEPGTVADPYVAYDTTVSPVTFNGQPVVLSAITGVASNYPIAAKQTAFASAATGALDTGSTVTYGAYATLVGMRTIEEYGSITPTVIQTWRITGVGSIGGNRPASVEVASVLERNVGSAHSFGVFATKVACGAVTFGGGASNDSYDSSAITWASGLPATQQTGGRVGTNGNLTVQGNAQVWGTLSSPRTGVGKCKDGAIVALTETGQAEVHEGLIQLPQAIVYPPPPAPDPMPPTSNQNMSSSTCASLGMSAPACTGASGDLTLDPQSGTLLFGNVTLNAGGILRLKAGTYNLNSIKFNGNAQIIVESGPVVFNIAGVDTNTPIDFTGGTISNPSFQPTDFKILYGGTGDIKVTGGSTAAAMIYAPDSSITVAGGSHFFGSIVGAEVKDTGGTAFHYDRRLGTDFFVVGNYVMSSFTWRKY
jgi:Tfp pilus assembly protein PilX